MKMGTFESAYQHSNRPLCKVNRVMREHIEEKQLVCMSRKCHTVPVN